jgi:hypothetical protein
MNKKHGMRGTRTYSCWKNMTQRCHNPKKPNYDDYGGRGISVCDGWRSSFIAFLDDMGLCPSNKHSIDRIDNNSGYFKENCRWATRDEQARNRRTVKLYEYDGRMLCASELAQIAGVSYWTMFHRLGRLGWSVYDAVNTPPDFANGTTRRLL